MKRILAFILTTLACTNSISGQSDTLQDFTVAGVMNLIYEEKDSANAIILSNYLTKRARFEKDSAAASWGHYGNYLYRKRPNNLPYLDSLIYTTRGLGGNEEIFALVTKGEDFYYEVEDYPQALKLFIKARELSVKTDNYYYIKTTTNALASTKFLTGEYHESLNLYHRYRKFGAEDTLALYFNIANCHFALKDADSLSHYSRIGIRQALTENQSLSYGKFLRLNGVAQYLHGNLLRALDSLRKARNYANDALNLQSSYYYSALTHDAMGNSDSTIYYLKKTASLKIEPEIYFPEIKSVWYRLYENARKNNDIEKQLMYIDNFMDADSILESKSKGLLALMDKSYDLPLSKERLNQLISEKKSKRDITLVSIVISFLFAFALILLTRRFLNQKKRLELATANPKDYLKSIENPAKKSNKFHDIPPNLNNQLNDFFADFKERKGFLDSNISLQKLSLLAETNTSYLSAYLNANHSGYSNFINSQRVQYAFRDMPENPEIFKFTLEHIARVYGFSSLRAFNRAFEKFLKIRPRDYLHQIKRDNS